MTDEAVLCEVMLWSPQPVHDNLLTSWARCGATSKIGLPVNIQMEFVYCRLQAENIIYWAIVMLSHVRALHEDTARHRGRLPRPPRHPLHRHQVNSDMVSLVMLLSPSLGPCWTWPAPCTAPRCPRPSSGNTMERWRHAAEAHNNFLSNNKMLDIKEAERMSKFVLILVWFMSESRVLLFARISKN